VASTVVIEGAGHWLANEQDVALADAISAFSRDVDATRQRASR
jgi:pimeloyl-ACP methyl ester carboxylesterase